MSTNTRNEPLPAKNVAVFADFTDMAFLKASLPTDAPGVTLFVTDQPSLIKAAPNSWHVKLDEMGIETSPFSSDAALAKLLDWRQSGAKNARVIVDMSWSVDTVNSARTIEVWGDLAERLSDEPNTVVYSLYDRELMIEEQVRAAFRAHKQFSAPSGLCENPYWLPAILRHAPPDEQMSFVLGRILPDYENKHFFERSDPFAARGAAPDWLAKPRRSPVAAASAQRWNIYCLGQLRVYKNGNERVEWNIPGSAPKKTRTLFAYLLNRGEQGAHSDRIAELLWPEGGSEKTKRARLHHTVAMLRKTLGDNKAVLRTGDYYRLNPPAGSWVDITNFEQICRRGVTLLKRGQEDECLKLYSVAEQLYGGDLFEDLPLEYVDNELEEWCMPRRIWLREMAVKLQKDTSVALRRKGRLREALEHCQKALRLDPTNEDANIELMQVFYHQGRVDTVARQYRQYKTAMEANGTSIEGSDIQAFYRALTLK